MGKRWRLLLDLAGMLAVLAVSAWVGASYLFGPLADQSATGQSYRASIGMACGKGLANVSGPAVDDFLNQKITELSPAQIPEDAPTTPLAGFQTDHRYLLYLLGLVWRVFGISWKVYRLLLVSFLCLMGLTLYFLFRLGMNPVFSAWLAISVVRLDMFYQEIADLRDFSKGLFILVALCLLGLLVKKPVKRAWFWLTCLFLGIVTGVGIGFRLDVLICVFPATVIIAFCRRPHRWAILERLAGLVLFASAFTALAYPIFFSAESSGSELWHHFMMGMANDASHNLGLHPASYDWIYGHSDGFVAATAENYRERLLADQVPSANLCQEKRQFVMDFLRTFPGDVITRAYAAVLKILEQAPFLSGLSGVFFAVTALLIIGSRSMYQGFLALFLLLYFCGYGSIQFQERHVFHLLAVSAWCLGFVADCAARRAGKRLVHSALWIQPPNEEAAQRLRARRRAVVFGILAAACLASPMLAGRAWQRARLAEIVPAFASAQLAPAESARENMDNGQVRFSLTHDDPFFEYVPYGIAQFVPPPYYVAEFSASPSARCFLIEIESTFDEANFSGVITMEPSGRDTGGTVRCFFPVYDSLTAQQWNRFAGIRVAQEYANDFRGFYRVTSPLPVTPAAVIKLPSDMQYFRYGTTLNTTPWPKEYDALDWTLHHGPRPRAQYQELARHDPDYAAGTLGSPTEFAALGLSYKAQGDTKSALDIYHRGIDQAPDAAPFYSMIDDMWQGPQAADARAHEWQSMTERYPGSFRPWLHLGQALGAKGDTPGAVDAFKRSVAIKPTIPALRLYLADALTRAHRPDDSIPLYEEAFARGMASVTAMQNALTAFRDSGRYDAGIAFARKWFTKGENRQENALAAFDEMLAAGKDSATRAGLWRSLTDTYPREPLPWVFLGGALQYGDDFTGAAQAYDRALTLDKGNVPAAAHRIMLLAEEGNTATATDQARRFAQTNPWKIAPIMDLLEDTASRAARAGKADKEIRLYSFALTLNGADAALQDRLGMALRGKGELDAARHHVRAAIDLHPESDNYYMNLVQIYKQMNDEDGLAKALLDIQRAHPDVHPRVAQVYTELGAAFEARGDVDRALQTYRKGLDLNLNEEQLLVPLIQLLIKEDRIAEEEALLGQIRAQAAQDGQTRGPLQAVARALTDTARNLTQSGKAGLATTFARQAAALAPEDATILTTLGDVLSASGDSEGALQAYRKAFGLDPGSANEVLPRITGVYEKTNNLDGAAREWAKFVQDHSGLARPLVELARVYQKKRDYDAVIEACNKAIALEQPGEDNSPVRLMLGDALTRKGAWDAATKVFNDVLNGRPDIEPPVYNALEAITSEFQQQGNLDNAVEACGVLLALSSAHYWGLVRMGELLCAKGDPEGGAQSFMKAIAVQPRDFGVYDTMTRCCADSNDLDSLLLKLRALVGQHPDAAPAQYFLAMAAKRKGDLESAAAACRAAAQLDASNARLVGELGQILLLKKDYPGAIEQFRAALKLDGKPVESHICLIRALIQSNDIEGARAEVAKCHQAGLPLPEDVARQLEGPRP